MEKLSKEHIESLKYIVKHEGSCGTAGIDISCSECALYNKDYHGSFGCQYGNQKHLLAKKLETAKQKLKELEDNKMGRFGHGKYYHIQIIYDNNIFTTYVDGKELKLKELEDKIQKQLYSASQKDKKTEESKMEYKTGEEVEVLIVDEWKKGKIVDISNDPELYKSPYKIELEDGINPIYPFEKNIRKSKITSESIDRKIESIEKEIKEVKGMVEKLNEKENEVEFCIGGIYEIFGKKDKESRGLHFLVRIINEKYGGEERIDFMDIDCFGRWLTEKDMKTLNYNCNKDNYIYKYKGQLSEYLKEVK
jgi:hypothetical protein